MAEKLEQILSRIGLGHYLQAFVDAGIDLDILADLDAGDFRELGVNLGDQKRILREIRQAVPDSAVVERRFLSLLFIDVVGSTEMSVLMDPEDYRQTMFAYQSKCEEILEASGGHLARKFGDGILAYFGFPQSHENDTHHAAQAALEILAQIPKLPDLGRAKLELRIGIASGMALVDENPSDDGRERGQVFGETPNLAARLQHLAAPDSIVVCDATGSVLSGHFDLADLGTHALKGLPAPVRAWRLKGASKVASVLGEAATSNTRPLINRVQEIETVRSAWARALNGHGQIVILRGCAGIGKSSLVGHLIDVLDDQDPVTVYWRCDIDQRGRPLHPVAAQLDRDIEQRAIFLGGDKAKATQDWLVEYCSGFDGAEAGLASVLSAGRSLKEGANSADVRAAMFALLHAYLETLQTRHPVKLIIEDLHWIDPTTLEFLDELVGKISDKRILILGSERDNEPVSFPDYPNLIREELGALDASISQKILEREFSHIDAPSSLKTQIIERCEGIPLYIEEVARAVLESNRRTEGEVLVIPDRTLDLQGTDLPTSLLGPLLSRLESRAGARELASIASTIGRRFTVRMLRYLSDMPIGQIRSILAQLVSAQILRRIDERDGGQYEFAHSVMQEAAYQVLLKDRRLEAHKRIAETLQGDFALSVEAKPANIAHHYAASEMWPEARTFWINAALEMQHFGAHREAVQYCTQALEANGRCSKGDVQRDSEIEIRELMFTSQESSVWWSKDIVSNLGELRRLRKDRGDSAELLTVVNGLAGDHLLSGRLSEAKILADEMLEVDNFPSNISNVLAHRVHGICDFFSGHYSSAIAHFDAAIEGAANVDETALKQYYFANVSLVSRAFVVWAKVIDNSDEDVSDALAEVIAQSEAEPDDIRKLYAQNLLACVHQSLGDPEGVLRFSEPAQVLAKQADQIYWHGWALIMSGWAHSHMGQSESGIDEIRQGLSDYISTGVTQFVPYARALLCDALCVGGRTKEAADLLDSLLLEGQAHEMRYVDPMLEEIGRKLGRT